MRSVIPKNYIDKVVHEYAKSPEGKAHIKRETGLEYRDKINKRELIQYGNAMRQILWQHINPLIKSVTIDDIVVGAPKVNEDGLWSIELSFKDGALHRDSLNDESDGLNNIVLLFAKGYHASTYVYGLWDRSGTGAGDYVRVRSVKDREGNDFLIDAVEEFNRTASNGFVAAALLGDYKECSENPV